MGKIGLVVALIVLMVSDVYAQAVETLDVNHDGRPDVWFYDVDAGTKRIDRDSDFDGLVDESTWLHGEHDILLRMEHDYAAFRRSDSS